MLQSVKLLSDWLQMSSSTVIKLWLNFCALPTSYSVLPNYKNIFLILSIVSVFQNSQLWSPNILLEK